jgi:hypothetical protein
VAGCSGNAAPGGAGSPSASGAGRSSGTGPAALAWSAARAPLPAAARGVSGQYVSLTDVSCPRADWCVAVGSDRSSASRDSNQGLVETLASGRWTPAAMPDVFSEEGIAELTAVACPALGTCVAVGFVSSPSGAVIPAIETLAGGRWHPARPPLPADAATAASATLNDVACPAAGACVATGWYTTDAGTRDAYADTLASGSWTAASVPLPADAAPEQSTATASTYLAAVACPAAGTCVAPGQYRDARGQTRAFIDTLAGGAWTAAKAPLPADAAASGQVAGLWAVGCPAAGSCVAAGHYLNGAGQPRYLAETRSAAGAWTAAALSLPADAAADQQWTRYGDTTVGGLACVTAGNCVASAGYVTKPGALVPLIETLSGGTWTAAKAPLPADAAPQGGQAHAAYLELVACPAAGRCLMVGSYPAADGTVEGLIETAAARHG